MTMKNERGFTLVELLVAMVVFVFAMIAATNSFMPLVNQFKQQGKITETQVEGIIGLDMLRLDIEKAGFGLPWFINDINNNNDLTDDWNQLKYKESNDSASYNAYDDTDNAPRAILVGNNVGLDTTILGINSSDYLVIKAVNVRLDDEAQKWSYTYLHPENGLLWQPDGTAAHEWKDGGGAADNTRNMDNSTKVIALKPSQNDEYYNILITEQDPDTGEYVKYYDTFQQFDTAANLIKPFDPSEIFVLYGIGPDNSLGMPFNRADFYISNPATSSVPGRCAAGTGVLHKGVIAQVTAGGQRVSGPLPLVDCVADMQVIAGLDTDSDGAVDSYSEALLDPATGPTAQDIRIQVKEIRVYILMHEGQRDPNFNYPNPTIDVGEFSLGKTAGGGNSFNFAAEGITFWQNYRWKVHTMVIKPDNLNPNN
jgi:prepilin-type N-terminal cleavage/methylation domain-containing protein